MTILVPETVQSPHLIHALLRKRSELAGRLEMIQAEARDIVKQIDSIDSTIRIFEPELDVDLAAPGAVPPPHGAFKGEVMRIILEALYEREGEVLTTEDFASLLLKDRGIEEPRAEIKKIMVKRAGACLRGLKSRGVVKQVPAEGRFVGWMIAPSE